jgi:hypothetical protein
MKSVSIYLDDVRSCPFGFHVHAFNYNECIYWLNLMTADNKQVNVLSLDHDLGDIHEESDGLITKYSPHEKTGYDVICWIEEQVHTNPGFKLPKKILCHSANPSGRANIERVIRKLYGQ